MSLFHAAARNHGGHYFNLKSILGDGMLLNEDCDEILHISLDQLTNHNLSMLKKQATTESGLEESLYYWMKKERLNL